MSVDRHGCDAPVYTLVYTHVHTHIHTLVRAYVSTHGYTLVHAHVCTHVYTGTDATRQCLMGGTDIDSGGTYRNNLEKAVETGELDIKWARLVQASQKASQKAGRRLVEGWLKAGRRLVEG